MPSSQTAPLEVTGTPPWKSKLEVRRFSHYAACEK